MVFGAPTGRYKGRYFQHNAVDSGIRLLFVAQGAFVRASRCSSVAFPNRFSKKNDESSAEWESELSHASVLFRPQWTTISPSLGAEVTFCGRFPPRDASLLCSRSRQLREIFTHGVLRRTDRSWMVQAITLRVVAALGGESVSPHF